MGDRTQAPVECIRGAGAQDWGYDIRVMNPQATVGDYVEILGQAIDEVRFPRKYADPYRENCFGCDRCCHERIPVTWPDALRLAQGLETGSWLEVLKQHCNIDVRGRGVDISLASRDDGSCLFLDREKRICSLHSHRPLTCRTYVCCRPSRRAGQLRNHLINSGMDQLVREWLLACSAQGSPPFFHQGEDPRPQLADWPDTPWTGPGSHESLLLSEVCPPALWERLSSS